MNEPRSIIEESGARRVAVPETELVRAIRWYDAFWIASGVPALLVFSVGYVAILNGPVSVVIWIAAVLIGLAMAFVYAELAGMFPEKSGWAPGLRSPGVEALLQADRAAEHLGVLVRLVFRHRHRRAPDGELHPDGVVPRPGLVLGGDCELRLRDPRRLSVSRGRGDHPEPSLAQPLRHQGERLGPARPRRLLARPARAPDRRPDLLGEDRPQQLLALRSPERGGLGSVQTDLRRPRRRRLERVRVRDVCRLHGRVQERAARRGLISGR